MLSNIRSLVAIALCTVCTACAALGVRNRSVDNGPTDSKYLETIRVSDDVYVFKPKIDWIHGNGVAILGPKGVVFVDTYIQFNYAEEAIRLLRGITPLPVRFVVNTHPHTDHVTGNAVFKRVFPGSNIIVQDSAVANLERNNRPFVADQLNQIKGNLAQVDSEIAAGKTKDGTPIVGSMPAFWQWQRREALEYLASYHPETYAPPDITFSDSLTIPWGSETLELIHTSDRGHSAADVMIWIPEHRILLTGDIVVGPTPYATYPNIPGMISSLHKVMAMNPAVIIPGHGEVLHDLAYVRLLDTAFTTYRHAAEQVVAAKVPVRTAMTSIAFPAIDTEFTHGDATLAWAYRLFFVRNLIYQTYLQLAPAPPG